jgi:hypothetical protein
MYVKKSGEGATMVSPTGGISGASGSSQGSADAPEGGWSGLSNSEKAAYFADPKNAFEGDLARSLQSLFGFTTLGMAQKALDPGFVNAMGSVYAGIDPGTGLQGQGSRGQTGLHGDKGVFDAFGNLAGTTPDSGPPGADPASDSGRDAGNSGSAPGGGAASGGLMALAQGGISHLGDYSDGGRLLRGPGEGISDSIPAMIGKKQPARLADGEFVVPARIVSELGNGSTEAGARKLYAMMDRVQKARGKTVGKGKVAANSRSAKYLPA